MGKNHKRHSKLELGLQAWISYNIRFVMEGDQASAWETSGCVDMQLTHIGAVLNLYITENDTMAMTYDQKIRTYASELSKFPAREEDIVNLPMEASRRIKREVLRECGSTTAFAPRNADLGRKRCRTIGKAAGKTTGRVGNAMRAKEKPNSEEKRLAT